MRYTTLDTAIMEQILTSQIMVRVAVKNLPPSVAFKNGQLHMLAHVVSKHNDGEGNECVLWMTYEFKQPQNTFVDTGMLRIEDISNEKGGLDSKRAEYLLSLWEGVDPAWLSRDEKMAIYKLNGQVYQIKLSESHVHRCLSMLLAVLATTINHGHELQNYLCGVFYRLDSLLLQITRQTELHEGLLIQTPSAT